MKKNTAAMSVTILMQPISVIWILSFICIKTAKNSKNFSKTAKDSVCITSVTLWKSEKKTVCQRKTGVLSGSFSLMEENMKRLEEEVTWFCDKQDYLNRDKDWGNSKDSIQRAIQKLGGGYPADPVFKIDY